MNCKPQYLVDRHKSFDFTVDKQNNDRLRVWDSLMLYNNFIDNI